MIMKKGTKTNPERVWKYIKIPKDPNGCWEWQGSKNKGYGKMSFNYKTVIAHRFMYEYLVGEIPEGLTIDHLCRNKGCINPDHLEPVPLEENLNRGVKNNQNKNKTDCKNGHKFTKENTIVNKRDHRTCRICARKISREYIRKIRQQQKLLVVAN